MKTIILFAALIISFKAQATIFIVAFDKATGAMGMAVSSSGPAYLDYRRINRPFHGQAIANAGGMGYCKRATPDIFIEQGLSAKEIVKEIARQCDPVQPYYRLAVVTANGDVAVHSGADGCNPDNHVCANLQGDGFGVTGGGLLEGVAEATFEEYKSIPQDIPLECRLHRALSRTYEAGGEIWNFKVASIQVSYPNQPEIQQWEVRGKEYKFLGNLQWQMQRDGINCPGWEVFPFN